MEREIFTKTKVGVIYLVINCETGNVKIIVLKKFTP